MEPLSADSCACTQLLSWLDYSAAQAKVSADQTLLTTRSPNLVTPTLACMRNYLALDPILRALADPTRRLIIERLCERDASVTAIADPLPLSLGQVTRQIRALERAGVIRTHKTGSVRTCWLEPQIFDLLAGWVAEQRGRWERRRQQR
jgi:DNA-binding transcriptional ArsR family regulator